MEKFEKLVEKIMRECEQDGEPVTREEAEEMAQMEMKAQGVDFVNARAAEPKPETAEKRKRTVKYSDEKVQIFTELKEFLAETYGNVEILKENKLFCVKIGDKSFKIDIIAQRKPKK